MATEPTTFKGYLAKHAPEVTAFDAGELLVKGGAHAANRLNTDPPKNLWPNVIPLLKLLQKLRERVGVPVFLTSVYRSPAYNKAIGGAPGSQHMQFKAADLYVVGRGNPADWAATLREMRSAGVFKGGIGTYDTFVHVDVRGTNADFDYRTGPKVAGRALTPYAALTPTAPAPLPSPRPAPPDPEAATAGDPAPKGFWAALLAFLAHIFGGKR